MEDEHKPDTLKTVSERLHDRFSITFRGAAERQAAVHVSGPIETADQMDAAIEALKAFRAFLA